MVLGRCGWFWVVVGGFRSFLVLVSTFHTSIHLKDILHTILESRSIYVMHAHKSLFTLDFRAHLKSSKLYVINSKFTGCPRNSMQI